MWRVASILSVSAAVLLLLPWRVCDCSEDGIHLKVIWDASTCHEGHLPPADLDGSEDEPGEPPVGDCHEIFTVSGSRVDPPVALPGLLRADLHAILAPSAATPEMGIAARSHAEAAHHAPPLPPPSPLALRTQLLT